MCSVKTAENVKKADIPEVLAAIRGIRVKAPVAIGDIVCPNIAGTGVNLVATAND